MSSCSGNDCELKPKLELELKLDLNENIPGSDACLEVSFRAAVG